MSRLIEEQLGALGARRLREQARQQEAADHQHDDDGQRAPHQGRHQAGAAAPARWRQRAEREDDRHERDVLEQQHGEGRAADRAAAIDQRREHQGSGGQGQGRSRAPSPPSSHSRPQSATAISSADRITSAAPMPKTSRRMPHRRRSDSSRPIENSSRMMPNSANGSIASRFEMVT